MLILPLPQSAFRQTQILLSSSATGLGSPREVELPGEFSLSVTLPTHLAANMTTFMTSLRRSHADFLLTWTQRTLAKQGNHYNWGLRLPLLSIILQAVYSLRHNRMVKQSRPQQGSTRASVHATGHVVTTTGSKKHSCGLWRCLFYLPPMA